MDEADQPKVRHRPPAADAAVFNCLVYVSRTADGLVRARVANLPGIEVTAASEREALGKVVPAFKRRIGELLANGTVIPWLEPPTPAGIDEQKRFIRVHL